MMPQLCLKAYDERFSLRDVKVMVASHVPGGRDVTKLDGGDVRTTVRILNTTEQCT